MTSWDHCIKLSRRLSRVMDDIGLNEEVVMSRRRVCLVEENLLTLHAHLLQTNRTNYNFGSQSEGTTTDGLDSDVDQLFVMEEFTLLQNLDTNYWAPDKINLLMIQDESFPGYCKLQLLKPDGPCPEVVLPSDKCTFDEAGRVILNHIYTDGIERHGPAEQFYSNTSSRLYEFVRCIRCKTWPNGYKMWSTHPRKGTWPTQEMISYMENSGCFVVPVAHCLDEKKNESWRISTSLAERCLMFSLNITQLRCYTLIKMIVKTFIDPVKPDIISSYMFKTMLFHCIENTKPDFWQESNLLRCVNTILLNMLEAIRCMNCPNYFNESINLFLGKVNKDNQVELMGVIWKVLISEGAFIRKIGIDNINELIDIFDNELIDILYKTNNQRKESSSSTSTPYNQLINIHLRINVNIRWLMLKDRFIQKDWAMQKNTLCLFALQGPTHYVIATSLFSFLCSHLATVKASEHILHGKMISEQTLLLYKRSLDSDATSSKLKFASYWYCTKQFERALSALEEVEDRLVDTCIEVCGCGDRKDHVRVYPITKGRSPSNQCLFPSHVSMCVIFSQAERRCCPRELQYEMYRSTEQEKLQRNTWGEDNWMDLACIHSLSYFYFMFYIVGRHLGKREISLLYLGKLKKYISGEKVHIDTVYNLLGQCYEYENKFDDAFACYCKSLRERPTNNAARWHIVLLLHKIYQKE